MRSSEGGEGQADTQRRIQIPVLVHAEPAAVPSVAAAAPPAARFAAPAPQPTTQPVRPCCLRLDSALPEPDSSMNSDESTPNRIY